MAFAETEFAVEDSQSYILERRKYYEKAIQFCTCLYHDFDKRSARCGRGNKSNAST